MLADCYFLAGSAAVAEFDDRFKQSFVNPLTNNAGLYAFNVWVRGIPTVVVVDDTIPYDRPSRLPAFARVGSDGALWGPLLEKAWAKINGNYERIALGFASEPFTFLTNSPSVKFSIDTLSTA